MSATSSVMIDRGTVAASTKRAEPSLAENPRTRRFAINPAVSTLEVHPTLSGRQLGAIPYGYPVRFDTFVGMKTRNWSVDAEDKSPPFVETDLTAKEALTNVSVAAWQGSRDMGFRELESLTPLDDEEAERLLAALLPALEPSACRYGADNTSKVRVERRVEVDGDGEHVKHYVDVREVEMFRCLSCTLDWLESDECKARAARGAAKQLRAELLAAFQTNEQFFKAKWQEWTAEMARRDRGEPGISVLGDDHEHVMRQLHEVAPAARAAETIANAQAAQAEAQKEGMREFAVTLAQELKAGQQPQPAFDMDEIVRRAKEAAKAELRAEMEAQSKNGKGGK